MNQNTSRTPASPNSAKQQGPSNNGGNSPITLIAIVVGVIVVGAVAYKAMHKDAATTTDNATTTAPADNSDQTKSKVVTPREPSSSGPSTVSSTLVPKSSVPAEPKPPVTGAAKDLVTSLAALDPKKGSITKEQAAEWKEKFKALVAQGKDAVPAIREFLERNVELSYANSGASLGYNSLRASMIDALAQIGGPDATAALLGTLNTTALPSEIQQLARALDQIAPGQYSQDILNAARQTLELAMSGGLGKEDAGPLFDLIQKASASGTLDPATLADLQKAAQNYKWYPVITLANMPGDAGIDTLINMSKDPNAPSTVAEVLGEKAWDNPKALSALEDLVRNNRITASQWQQIIALMSGDQYLFGDAKTDPTPPPQPQDCQYFHIEWNNQNFSRCHNPNFQPDKGIAALNQMLGVTTDPNIRNIIQDRIKQLQSGGK